MKNFMKKGFHFKTRKAMDKEVTKFTCLITS